MFPIMNGRMEGGGETERGGKWKEMRGRGEREGGRNREKIDGVFGNNLESLDSFSDSFQ